MHTAYPRVSIGVVLYKGERYIPFSLPSLFRLSYPGEVEFFFVDYEQFSAEKEAKKLLPKKYPSPVFFLRSEQKKWHSGGHNMAIARATGKYYLCASVDMLYDENFLLPLVQALESNSHYASATGALLYWDFKQKEKTTRIDSLGLSLSSFHRCRDIFQGKDMASTPASPREVFGASGALALYRISDLNAIAQRSVSPPQYFDELLHYKDDVDMAYRLQWLGKPSVFVPHSRVWHHRQVSTQTKKTRFAKENSLLGNSIVLHRHVLFQGFSLLVSLKTFLLFFGYLFVSGNFFLPFFLWFEYGRELRRKKAEMPKNVSSTHFSQFFSSPFPDQK